jgi:hypothetical protein
VEVSNIGKSIDVAFKVTKAGNELRERVKRLTAEECIEVCAQILVRNAGSKRRKIAMLTKNGGAGPSTKILTPSAIATHTPELFWALYDNSRYLYPNKQNVFLNSDNLCHCPCATLTIIRNHSQPQERTNRQWGRGFCA